MITIDTMILFLIIVIFFYSFEIICKSQALKENFSLPFFGDDEEEGGEEGEEGGDGETGETGEAGEAGGEILIGGQPLWIVIVIAVVVILLIGVVVYKLTSGDDDDQIGGAGNIIALLDSLL